ncbi:MAG: hypothetical protein IJT02_02885 [Synergistaceae bacterium]|nr:hypothetical protein [Synergistaceae bacterium]
MSDTTYTRSYTQIQDIPAPDDLVSGWFTANPINIASDGGLKRGTLLMSNGDNIFTPAEKAGIANAYELAILCEDIPDDATECAATAYFTGLINGASIILPYETDSDVHSELIEAARPALRRSGFTII